MQPTDKRIKKYKLRNQTKLEKKYIYNVVGKLE